MTHNSDKKTFFQKNKMGFIILGVLIGSILTGCVLIPYVVGHYGNSQIPVCPPNQNETDVNPPVCIPPVKIVHDTNNKTLFATTSTGEKIYTSDIQYVQYDAEQIFYNTGTIEGKVIKIYNTTTNSIPYTLVFEDGSKYDVKTLPSWVGIDSIIKLQVIHYEAKNCHASKIHFYNGTELVGNKAKDYGEAHLTDLIMNFMFYQNCDSHSYNQFEVIKN